MAAVALAGLTWEDTRCGSAGSRLIPRTVGSHPQPVLPRLFP